MSSHASFIHGSLNGQQLAVNFVSEYEQSYFHQHLFARERERERDRDRDGGKAGDRQSHHYMRVTGTVSCLLFRTARRSEVEGDGASVALGFSSLESGLLL